MLKYSFNMIDDGLVGQQILLGETTRLAYMTDEAAEGRDAFLEKRAPDFSDYPGTTEFGTFVQFSGLEGLEDRSVVRKGPQESSDATLAGGHG